jgi:hypothetical protein
MVVYIMKELYENALLSIDKSKFKYKVNKSINGVNKKLAVIIDPRYNDLMLSVIHNFMSHLNPHGWNLLVVTHSSHKDRVKKDIPGCGFMAINPEFLDEGHKPNMSIENYNKILMDAEFWRSLPAENILIFQTDCYMYKMFDELLYLSYDYVGANWFNPADMSPRYGGINGGCSLRSRQSMLDCLEFVSWKMIENVRENQKKTYGLQINEKVSKMNEDVYFTIACEILNKKVVPIAERPKFAVECEFDPETCFYHGWNKNYQTDQQTILMLSRFS